MFKKLPFIFFVLSILIVLVSCRTKKQQSTLVVYACDSFSGSWGPGQQIVKDFEAQTGIKVNLVGCEGASTLYSRFLFDSKKTSVDVVIGLTDSMDVNQNLFLEWEPDCKKSLIDYQGNRLIPYDYGYYCFLVNKNKNILNTPSCLEDLLLPQYKGKFILIDPRTSSVGLGLLQWTYEALGAEKALQWWKNASENALTTASSWSLGYGLFSEGEADYIISYNTSPLYHITEENNYNIQALEFTDGHICTTEFVAISKQSKMQKEAKQFCNYLLTKGQQITAISNSMLPANKDTELTKAFSYLIIPKEIKKSSAFIRNQQRILQTWSEELAK